MSDALDHRGALRGPRASLRLTTSRSARTSPAGSVTVCRIERSLFGAVAGAALASALACLAGAHLLWNWTPSLPLGLYWVSPRDSGRVKVGALVAFPVPAHVRALVLERRYLPPGALLVKPVVATAADRVCTEGGELTVNGAPLGAVATEDTQGRPLPSDPRCGPLSEGEVFVASHFATSFDSRTFGPVPLADIRGTVTPLWTY
jgi:conjugative transfer signal peptidase TraF